MTNKTADKLQVRSVVLRTVGNLRAFCAQDAALETHIENAVLEFLPINDKEFLAELLLKEMEGANSVFDAVLANIFVAVLGEFGHKCIWRYLSGKNVPDTKKLFLIDLLREISPGTNYAEVANVFQDCSSLADLEAQRFIEMAKMNPEAQIDFLDFYFGVNDEDKSLLLSSMIEELKGAELIGILLPVIYLDKNVENIKICIETLGKSKSYLAFGALDWIISNFKDESVIRLCKKTKNELKMAGLRENLSEIDAYKELLHGSIPYGFWVCAPDGCSSFPCVFARERKNGTIQTFFSVINLKDGPLACFGFNELSKEEFEIVLSRFFKSTDAAMIPVEVGVKILNEKTEKALLEGKKVPYEIMSWRQITLDIRTDECGIEDILAENLSEVPLGDWELKRIFKGGMVDNWFIKWGENEHFDKALENIIYKEKPDINYMESQLKEFRPLIFDENVINEQLLYHAYFTSKGGLVNIGNILYSLIPPSKTKDEFLLTLLKKSLYEFFLSVREDKLQTDKKTFFTGKKNKISKNVDFNYFIGLIESEWIK